jgi:hypothetical protein
LTASNTAALEAASTKCTTEHLDIPEVPSSEDPPPSSEPTGTTTTG